jgi:hypothetical protein
LIQFKISKVCEKGKAVFIASSLGGCIAREKMVLSIGCIVMLITESISLNETNFFYIRF